MSNVKGLYLIIKQLNRILSIKQKRDVICVCIITIIGSLFELLGVTAILPFLQALLSPDELLSNEWIAPLISSFRITSGRQLMMLMGVILILLYLIKNAYMLFMYYAQYDFSTRIQRELSIKLLHAYMRRPYIFFLNINSTEIVRSCNDDVLGVHNTILYLYTILGELLSCLLISIYLIHAEPFIACVTLVLMTAVMLAIILAYKPATKRYSSEYIDARTEQYKTILETASGIKELFALQRKELFIGKYEEVSDLSRKAQRNYEFINNSPNRIIEGICVGGLIGIVVIRLSIGVEIASFIPVLGAFAMAAFKIMPSIGKLSSRMNGIVYNRLYLANVYNVIVEADSYEASISSYILDEDKQQNINFLREITVNDICWKYDKANNEVLKNVSIRICRGESVALIGESGAGKTTLADMILGLLPPQEGSICVDGVNIFSIPKRWAQLVGYVPQAIFLIDDSIRANIAFGVKNVNDDDIWAALERAQLKDFVKGLSDGLDTITGERGIKLSGGQRQRIAIARALYNKPEILILDEATAALDSDTENAVMESIDALQGQVTLIIVAHRLTTIRNCDKIYEIKNGRAVLRKKEEVLEML